MKLSNFKFKLPEEQIAQYPSPYRDDARLMVVHRKTGEIEHAKVSDTASYFEEGDVFVFNDTASFPARLYAKKEKTNAEIEVFLLRELNREMKFWDVLVDPARKIRIGNKLYFGEDIVVDDEIKIAEFLNQLSQDEIEKMASTYAESPEWSRKVNSYIDQIKAENNMMIYHILIVFTLFSLSYLNAAPKRQTSPSPAAKAENRDDSPARAVDEKPAAKPANGDWGEEDELTEFLEKKAAEEDDTVIVIKTNVSRADIYLNGIYRGQSDLSLKNLRPGTYSLRVEKKGYETVRRRIRVRAGKEIVYHIDMQKLYGFLRINNNVPSMKPGEVAADSSITKMDIGYHSLHYTRFGYYDVNKNVEIFPYLTTDIQVVFSPCPFEVSAFSASSRIAFAILSLTEPAGLKYSNFAKSFAFNPNSFSICVSSSIGVFPIN